MTTEAKHQSVISIFLPTTEYIKSTGMMNIEILHAVNINSFESFFGTKTFRDGFLFVVNLLQLVIFAFLPD